MAEQASEVPEQGLSPSALMAEAADFVGHHDWGDRGFVEPLGLLIDSCRATGRTSAVGWRVLRSVALRHLRNRLYLRRYLQRRPEATQRSLGNPLIITGLPRTGTTLLHNLLAQDPRHRFLRLWEALHPVPPEDADDLDEATLVAKAEKWLERLYTLAPDFRAIHPLSPRGPEECDRLLQNAFAGQHFVDMFDAEAYSRWFYQSTLTREYADYALQLRALTREAEGTRWVLKSPGHLGHLGSLYQALPGAVVLHCHRDPVEAVPSYASLIQTVRTPNSLDVATDEVGSQALERCATAMGRALDVRAAARGRRFVDVSYPSLVADPLHTVRRIYGELGAPLDRSVEESMRRWLADNPRTRYGVHRYDPEEFGLPADRVKEAFASYRGHYAPLLAAG